MNGLTDLAAGLPWSRRVTLIAALLALIACLGYGAVSVRDANASQTVLEEEGEQKLTAAPGEASERSRFGSSVALSGNGALALVGAPSDDGGVGAAFTFSRSEEGGWTQQGTPLTVPAANTEGEGCSSASSEEIEEAEEGEEAGEEGVAEAHACHFGRSVALSEDGSTAVVGAPREDGSRGAVWIYTRSGSSWTQATELSSPEPGLSRHFGVSVAASANGDTIAVGAPLLRGRVWVFTRSGSSWVAVGGALAGPGEEGEAFFGHSIALSADGETVAVGGPGDNGKHGAAWIFTRSGPGWVQQGSKITGAGEISEGRFGSSVALSGDGSTALVGARGDDEGVGAAWLYSETGSGWAQQGPMLKGHEEASEGFGYSVALSSGGTRALVGADDGENARGDARLFERSGSTWQLQAQLGAKLTQRGAARYGSSVALSSEGRWMLLGGPFSEKMGAAWMFGPRPSVTSVKPESGPSDGGTKVEIQGENLTGTEAVSFGAVAADEFEVTSAKSILVTSPPGMGKVDITVKTPFGVSSTSEADEFTYKISTGRGGGGGKGAGGEGGASGSGGSGAAAGGTTPGASGPSSETVVLGFGATRAPSCGASLLSRKISVQRNYRALLKLVGAGAGACCSGKLRLQVRTKASKRRYRTRTIGTASFSIAASTRVTVKIRLNGLGRALLASRHGSLEASLVIVKSKPSPTRAHTASVRLTRR